MGNKESIIFLYCCLCLCSCGVFKKDIIKAGEGIEEVGQDVEIASEVIGATGKEIECVGKEIEEAAYKFKDKTIDEHTEKYLVKERKEDQRCLGNKSRTVSQRQKELSDDFEKEINKDKEAFEKGWKK